MRKNESDQVCDNLRRMGLKELNPGKRRRRFL